MLRTPVTGSAVAATLVMMSVVPASAQQTRLVEDHGIVFRESRTIVQKPVTEIQMRPYQQINYRLQTTTRNESRYQTSYVPLIQTYWRQRVHQWWNPFADPHVTYQPVQQVHWVPQMTRVEFPVTVQTYVPETTTVQRPVRTLKLVPHEHVQRVALGPAARNLVAPTRRAPTTQIASQPKYGGVQRFDQPPTLYSNRLPGGAIVR